MIESTPSTLTTLRGLYTGDPAQIEETAPPVHPGEILREEFMVPLGLSAGAVAKALGLPRSRIERVVREEIGISTDTALRLARFFGTTPALWLNLQQRFEMEILAREIGPEIEGIKPLEREAG